MNQTSNSIFTGIFSAPLVFLEIEPGFLQTVPESYELIFRILTWVFVSTISGIILNLSNEVVKPYIELWKQTIILKINEVKRRIERLNEKGKN